MVKRFVSIWFRYLTTDWFSVKKPELRKVPFVLRASVHGRMVITATNALAEAHGIHVGMVLADARAIVPGLQVLDDKPELPQKLLKHIAEWCIRFTPVVAVDPPDGIFLDATGCAHLWGGEVNYVSFIVKKFQERGYHVRVSIADTASLAWGVARYGKALLVPQNKSLEALLPLPPEALRVNAEIVERLHKLGLHHVRQFISIPRASLRRRFGEILLTRLDLMLGTQIEVLDPITPVDPYQERLPCLEPILTAPGIHIALEELTTALCERLYKEQIGLREAVFKAYRIDHKVEEVRIATGRATHHVKHILKLFELKLESIEPGPGIELFVLEAPKVEPHLPEQEKMWEGNGGIEDERLSELVDRIAGKIGVECIHRFIPAEHYWPERSFQVASSLYEKLNVHWPVEKLRPLYLLQYPEKIEVTAPIPDYPPMLFRYKGKVHNIRKADGPERIEQEWWIQQGQHRDYYRVEDEEGNRYWLFRLGHYHEKIYQWFIHGFFP